MSSLRELIRNLVIEQYSNDLVVHSFLDFGSSYYDKKDIKEQCNRISEDVEHMIKEMELSYFSEDLGKVNGAAWIGINENCFNFYVITDDGVDSDKIFEELVRNCLYEFDFLKSHNSDLMLEVKVEDLETESCLNEKFGLDVLRSYPGLCIMG